MKVTGVKVTQQSHPLSRRMGEARLPAGRLTESCCIIELMTDAGLTGIAIGSEGVRAHIDELVKDVLVGADPRGVTGSGSECLTRARRTRHGRYLDEAIALLDVALWDLKSKANDEPLWKTLGGARPRANAHASGMDLALSDEELSAWYVATARDYGLRGGKLQVGLDLDSRSAAPRTHARRVDAGNARPCVDDRCGRVLVAEGSDPPHARDRETLRSHVGRGGIAELGFPRTEAGLECHPRRGLCGRGVHDVSVNSCRISSTAPRM